MIVTHILSTANQTTLSHPMLIIMYAILEKRQEYFLCPLLLINEKERNLSLSLCVASLSIHYGIFFKVMGSLNQTHKHLLRHQTINSSNILKIVLVRLTFVIRPHPHRRT